MLKRFLKKNQDGKNIDDFINEELNFIRISLIITTSALIKARVYLFSTFKRKEESNKENK
jgi:hypothetical protein